MESTVEAFAAAADTKATLLALSRVKYFILSALAGAYIGFGQLAFGAAFARGILANWLVCLAVWSAARTSSDVAKLILIFFCLFAFVGAGFEHSVANMTLLALALFQPHGDAVSWAGFVQSMVPVTLGNIVGGAVFVGGLYWLATPIQKLQRSRLAVVETHADAA